MRDNIETHCVTSCMCGVHTQYQKVTQSEMCLIRIKLQHWHARTECIDG